MVQINNFETYRIFHILIWKNNSIFFPGVHHSTLPFVPIPGNKVSTRGLMDRDSLVRFDWFKFIQLLIHLI